MAPRYSGLIIAILVCSVAETAIAEYELKQPSGNWQVPGEIKQPKGTWQTPGGIQEPGQIQKVEDEPCRKRLRVAADALFAFDRAELGPGAEEALAALMAELAEASSISLEGHTDSKGSDPYNLELSERRARAVRDWLSARGIPSPRISVHGLGESRPIASNTNADGSDNPEGRAANRRVEAVVTTCD